MAELSVPVKGIEMQVEKGQGLVMLTLGPMTEKNIRALAAAAALGTLKVQLG